MTPLDIDRIRQIDNFDSLIVFLRDELEWPLEAEDIEELSFDYEPEELGLSEEVAVKINYIKQLRPLAEDQPWGIFYIDFEPKKLPVVVLRRVLQSLAIKKRASSQKSSMPGWQMNDLLFINSFGETEDRNITFAHFQQEDPTTLPSLKVIGWDGQDTPLHLDRCLNELGHLRFDADIDAEQWREQWASAFTSAHRHVITTSKKLAQRLAELARSVRVSAEHVLKYEAENGPFKKTMAKLKTALIHDLTEHDFADMYAQTIAYGLLYTAIRSHVSGEPNQISADRVQQLVLPTNPFLKEVMEDFFNIGARKWDSSKEMMAGIEFDELGVNEIIATLKDEQTDFDSILRDFGNKNPNEDPVIHFYELFLKEYDRQKRKSRGVYYTPQPVVSFIVRSVHELLIRDFNVPLGLADTTTWEEVIKNNPDIKLPEGVSEDEYFVQILDPAIGTGTFLVETIDLIYKTMTDYWQNQGKSEAEISALWNRYVPDCLLPRMFGFELMMAPYAIAHMKIGIKLYETDYKNFEQDKKRVQVYLTNTLEEAVDTAGYLDTLDPALAIETEQANALKTRNSITVVIGNPPYAGHSFNASKIKIHVEPGQSYQIWSKKHNRLITKKAGPKGVTQEKRTWIGKLIQTYFYVDDAPIAEMNPKWLNDDYVKFIRYAQYRLDNTGTGILGFITNCKGRSKIAAGVGLKSRHP
ncbi:N-6 DNA methylase, partial [Planctomycetota bacterium]